MKRKNFEANLPCIVCKQEGEGRVTFHHLFTQRVYPEFKNEEWNCIEVCQEHHNEFHNKGTVYMAQKYLPVYFWLIGHDWFFDDFLKKWRRVGF